MCLAALHKSSFESPLTSRSSPLLGLALHSRASTSFPQRGLKFFVVMLAQTDALSSILGWMSISCWIVVYSPQIVENYQLQSGEGLSVFFVLTWLVGDLCNLFGAILSGLLPTVKILASYYTVCDCILLFQIYYYRRKRSRKSTLPPLVSGVSVPPAQVSEETPLLNSNGSPTHRARGPMGLQFAKYAGVVFFICMTGVVAWFVDERIHRDAPRSNPEEVIEWKGQVLGWFSAFLFLGARIPQIMKNLQTRCEGLSPALFVFSIMGNTTYALSILAVSLSLHHLAANAAWLAGSGLTVFLDMFVLFQFFYYQTADRLPPASGES
ncbi:hypothetical protein QCA50_015285 [Cerrena zonata]|uniref:PQ-loop-domain-containing protein n=1 Tax=Cerrena zonata TaxID=2478898 RepID=A0AAW0FKB1_9APHY